MTSMESPLAQASFTSPQHSEPFSNPSSARRSLASISSQSSVEYQLDQPEPEPHKGKLDVETDFSSHFWSLLPAIPAFFRTPFKNNKKEQRIKPDNLSVPLKTFSKTSAAMPQVSGVVARREKASDDPENLADAETKGSDAEEFELAKVENNDPNRRGRGRRQLQQQQGQSTSYKDWLPSYFRTPSDNSPGFVQHLVLQALLSPSSEPGPNSSSQMGRRLYALMTATPSGLDIPYQSPLATRFRPKIDLYSEELLDGDFDRLSQKAQEDNRLVELTAIRRSFVPHKAHRLSVHEWAG